MNKVLISIHLAFFFCGCNTMLPYRDSFKCEKGIDSGVCGSVTEVYDMSDNMDELRKVSYKSESIQTSENSNFNYYQIKNEKKLRDIAHAVSIKQIQDGRPTVFNIYNGNPYAYEYEILNNQEVVEYLIKDEKTHNKFKKDESTKYENNNTENKELFKNYVTDENVINKDENNNATNKDDENNNTENKESFEDYATDDDIVDDEENFK